MKFLNIVAALIAALAIMSSLPANADNHAKKSQPKNAMQDRSEEVSERAQKNRDKHSQREESKRDRAKDTEDNDSDDGDVDLDDSYEDDSGSGIDRDEMSEGRDNAATRGNEKSKEMRARRDERKAIMEEYKGDRQDGVAEPDADNDMSDVDTDEDPEISEKKGKKPWWKFWGD